MSDSETASEEKQSWRCWEDVATVLYSRVRETGEVRSDGFSACPAWRDYAERRHPRKGNMFSLALHYCTVHVRLTIF